MVIEKRHRVSRFVARCCVLASEFGELFSKRSRHVFTPAGWVNRTALTNTILPTTALARAPRKKEIERGVAHVATFQSIQLRLPLSMTALLAAAVVAAMVFAYAQ